MKTMKIKFIKPHKGKSTGRSIGSAYSADGSYAKDLPVCRTVGELRAMLSQLPDSLPLNNTSCEPNENEMAGYEPVWFNVGMLSENLQFRENDGGDA